jgi:hypothetical protein
MRSQTTSTAALLIGAIIGFAVHGADRDLIPKQLPKEQRDNLVRFLDSHQKPDRFIPKDAKIVDDPPNGLDLKAEPKAGQTIKQYTVQITSHRPVPGQNESQRVDVYYYRPNPDLGKPGVTVKHTVDLTSGNQVGPTEVLLKHHTPISRDELDEAVALARDKSAEVKSLYEGRDQATVRWEYLQIKVNHKYETNDPGDRVVRLVYYATPPEGGATMAPVRVIVNLTKGVVSKDDR